MRVPEAGRLNELRNEAKRKAFDSLARYKFQMFGYHAAIWVYLNRISLDKQPNPFSVLVGMARASKGTDPRQLSDDVQETMEAAKKNP
jgi:hypothetical protein